MLYWLVVSTPLKNISQWEGLSHVLWKNIKCSKPPTKIYIYISNDMFQAPYGLHAPLLGHHGLPMFETTNQLVKSHSRVTHQWLPDPDL